MFSLRDKHVFISGGTTGIGLAVAESFLRDGAEVIISGRSEREQAKKSGARFLKCDQSVEKDVRSALESVTADDHPLDVLVVNAGVADEGASLADTDCEQLERMWRINTLGVAHFLKHAPDHVADGGSIIVTATPAAHHVFPGYAAYGASKAGIDLLVKHAAMELGSRGIRVNAISPGSILSGMQTEDDAEARMCGFISCLGRIGTPDDLLGAYHFLASDASRFMTAADLVIDGGWLGGIGQAAMQQLIGE